MGGTRNRRVDSAPLTVTGALHVPECGEIAGIGNLAAGGPWIKSFHLIDSESFFCRRTRGDSDRPVTGRRVEYLFYRGEMS